MDWAAPLWFFGLFVLLLAVGAPIAVALGATGLILIWQFQLGMAAIGPTFYANLAKFQPLAIPFFVMAGLILECVGISERLVRLASLLIGPVHGGLAFVAIVCCVFFAGISGSGPADTAALGTILTPAMAARGYAKPFASALICSWARASRSPHTSSRGGAAVAATATAVAPRSWPPCARPCGGSWRRSSSWAASTVAYSIIYGVIINTSIPALFAAGVLPGLTPTEAAVVAVFYGLFVGLVVYRSLTLAALWRILNDTAVSSAVVMLIVGFAGLYAWAGSTMGVIDRITQGLLGLSKSPVIILWTINLLVFLAGYILDAISIYYIFVPIIMPIMAAFGWDPLWIGVMLTVNIAIGQVTPPVAVNLYVAANVARLPVEEISRAVWPFVLAMLLALGIVVQWPALSTWLPGIFGLK
jgi:C4-dicarboxylate transporter, DctM subunit